jgi:uncharacterized protein (DUF1015 family)
VLPHEQTFPKHKADRLELMRAAHINGSPVFLFYRDNAHHVAGALDEADRQQTLLAEFDAADGQHHRLVRIGAPAAVEAMAQMFADRTLYIADGHHRYETALLYRDEVRAERDTWTGEEPENFALVGLVAEDDPGMLVLPTHRLSASPASWTDVRERLAPLFTLSPFAGSPAGLMAALAAGQGIGLAVAGEGLLLASTKDRDAVDRLLPADRTPAWRALDYAIANHAVMGYGLGLSDEQMKDQSVVWFTEDADEAVRQVEEGRARYAVLLSSVPVQKVLELADAGERMPQKSTFFYPKAPTGLVFNLLEE